MATTRLLAPTTSIFCAARQLLQGRTALELEFDGDGDGDDYGADRRTPRSMAATVFAPPNWRQSDGDDDDEGNPSICCVIHAPFPAAAGGWRDCACASVVTVAAADIHDGGGGSRSALAAR